MKLVVAPLSTRTVEGWESREAANLMRGEWRGREDDELVSWWCSIARGSRSGGGSGGRRGIGPAGVDTTRSTGPALFPTENGCWGT